ncbi:MAG: protein-tyrosine-phosphatase [Bacteroidota bacterium]|nr:protein-tyrosine-phosphatase [Bacteroidota bacterium]
MPLYPQILKFIEETKPLVDGIPEERKSVLQKISMYVAQKKAAGAKAELIFICTHNSRRSHFGQVWSKALAAYFGFGHVLTYSGGTEATAFNQNAIKAVKAAGFKVTQSSEQLGTTNPVYEVLYGEDPKVLAFSKKYDDPPNPTNGFCAIMTCNDADENCPLIFGSELRVSTPYQDPKKFDNSPQQDEKYNERCRQIASELFYMYTQVKSSIMLK